MLTILDRYLAAQFIATLFKALLTFVTLYILIDLLTVRLDIIDENEVPWPIVAQYYLAMTPGIIINYAAPFALLVTALLVLGNAAQNNEVTAALAGGISLRRFVRIPIVLAFCYAALILAMQETVGVHAARAADHVDRGYFAKSPEAERGPISWANLNGRWTCHIMKFNYLALTGEDVFIYSLEPDAHIQIRARRIFWEPDNEQWLLERGWWDEYNPQTDDWVHSKRITQEPAPFTESPDQLFALEQAPETKTVRELEQDIAFARARNMPVNPFLVTYHARFAQPALNFVMIWLAIPFAMRLRRGGLAISFGASIAIAIMYLMVFFVSMGLGQMERLSPITAAWLPNGVFLVAGLVLFRRTPS